ncbi:hypothetical protein Pcinc_019634 [Petrolisthes cinctipes]|uniref:Uncharacterized protein n=1 Tax=Petrolisthes cinctipes TaxID=88211 RepID=A0AAE1KLA7_PETCI|nr:hypothetical protein Pcinc_019634 [Petrolisthes cinctipes]
MLEPRAIDLLRVVNPRLDAATPRLADDPPGTSVWLPDVDVLEPHGVPESLLILPESTLGAAGREAAVVRVGTLLVPGCIDGPRGSRDPPADDAFGRGAASRVGSVSRDLLSGPPLEGVASCCIFLSV